MVASDISRLTQLAGFSDAGIFGSVLEVLALVLGAALVLHLLIDIFVLRGRRRAGELAGRERQLAAVAELSSALALAGDRESIARTVLDTLNDLVGFDFSGLVLVDADGRDRKSTRLNSSH